MKEDLTRPTGPLRGRLDPALPVEGTSPLVGEDVPKGQEGRVATRAPLTDLYQEVILDHNKQPRNFRKLEGANRKAEGYNPLCGDRVTVYLKMKNDLIEEIAFQGSGCAISKASSSLMTMALKGKTTDEVDALYHQFHQMVTGKKVPTSPEGMNRLAVFSGVSEFPARVKCATLAWHTARAAMEGKDETISTEEEDHGRG